MNTRKIAVVFPGQGSQRLGMAKDFVAEFAESREIFELASNSIGVDMQEICFLDRERLNQTEFMQPAILTAEMAMYAAFTNTLQLKPCYFAGHSLGEYTALVAAGALSFEDAIKIVNGRNSLMQSAVPEGSGSMAALIFEGIQVSCIEEILAKFGAEIANYNSPKQVVISGPNHAINSASSELKACYPTMRIVRLDVGFPFHCSYMKSVEPELEKYLSLFESKINLNKVKGVLSNLTGTFHQEELLIKNLVKQVSGCVQWQKCMDTLFACVEMIVEIGPNRVLNRLFTESGIIAKSIYNVRSLRSFSREFQKSL